MFHCVCFSQCVLPWLPLPLFLWGFSLRNHQAVLAERGPPLLETGGPRHTMEGICWPGTSPGSNANWASLSLLGRVRSLLWESRSSCTQKATACSRGRGKPEFRHVHNSRAEDTPAVCDNQFFYSLAQIQFLWVLSFTLSSLDKEYKIKARHIGIHL